MWTIVTMSGVLVPASAILSMRIVCWTPERAALCAVLAGTDGQPKQLSKTNTLDYTERLLENVVKNLSNGVAVIDFREWDGLEEWIAPEYAFLGRETLD